MHKSVCEDEGAETLDPAWGAGGMQDLPAKSDWEGMGTRLHLSLGVQQSSQAQCHPATSQHFSFKCEIQTIAFWAPQTELLLENITSFWSGASLGKPNGQESCIISKWLSPLLGTTVFKARSEAMDYGLLVPVPSWKHKTICFWKVSVFTVNDKLTLILWFI